eukprot:239753_1
MVPDEVIVSLYLIVTIVCFCWYLMTIIIESIRFKSQYGLYSISNNVVLPAHNSNGQTELDELLLMHQLQVPDIGSKSKYNNQTRTLICSKIIFASFTILLSTTMMINKLYFKFFQQNIWFINGNNFDFFNSFAKMLSILSLTYLWTVCKARNGVQIALKRMFIQSKWNSFERYFVIMMIGLFVSYNMAYEYAGDKDYTFYSLAAINMNIRFSFIVPLALSLDINLRNHHKCKNKLLLCTELFVFNILLLNIVFELLYALFVYIIDSESVNTNTLAITIWTLYGFCTKFWISKLMQMFAFKIIYHNYCVRPPKCQKVPVERYLNIEMKKIEVAGAYVMCENEYHYDFMKNKRELVGLNEQLLDEQY